MQFALKEGKIVHISEVENGLKCNSICASCKGSLIARKGKIKIPHFAHVSKLDCPYGIETAIHIAAKELFKHKKTIRLPEVSISHGVKRKEKKILHTARYINITGVKLEHKLEGIIPDVLLSVNGNELIVEIKVTHGIDDIKLEKIRKLGISAIEIDLSKKNKFVEKDELESMIIDELQNKRWVYNKKAENEKIKLLEKTRKIRVHSKRKVVWDCPVIEGEIEFKNSCFICPQAFHFDDENQIVFCRFPKGDVKEK